MKPSLEEAERLREELQDWFSRNDMSEGLKWRTPGEYYGEHSAQSNDSIYFVLVFEDSDLYYVINNYMASRTSRARMEALCLEFHEILRIRGFYFELENDGVGDIVGVDREDRNA